MGERDVCMSSVLQEDQQATSEIMLSELAELSHPCHRWGLRRGSALGVWSSSILRGGSIWMYDVWLCMEVESVDAIISAGC